MGAQTMHASDDAAILGVFSGRHQLPMSSCACDVSGAAFNYLASLNRYMYLFIYL